LYKDAQKRWINAFIRIKLLKSPDGTKIEVGLLEGVELTVNVETLVPRAKTNALRRRPEIS